MSKYSVNASQNITVDGTAPELNVTSSVDDYTNEDISLNVNATDLLSGLDYIKLPNGDIVKTGSCTFIVKNNGSFEFEAVDLVGNSTTKSITVSNIDKEKPTVKSSIIYNANKTEAIIKIESYDTLSGVKNITLPDKTVKDEETVSIIVKENAEYVFEVRDFSGNVYTEVVNVSELKHIINNGSNDSTNNDSSDTTGKDEMPNTGGAMPLITALSIASILGGILNIKRKKK